MYSQRTTILTALAFAAAPAVAAVTFEQRSISNVGWAASYQGCSYNSSTNLATYSYLMSITRTEKDLSHWVLVLDPSLVPVASTGGSQVSFGRDPTTGTYGFKWDDGQAKGTSQVYTVSFEGPCSEGTISYAVKGGTYFAIDGITGPVVRPVTPPVVTYSIDGVLFIDANGNQVRDTDEPTIPDMAVVLTNASGDETQVLTDSNGHYHFANNPNGVYQVAVPVIADAPAVNALVHQYALPYGSLANVQVADADVVDVDFGFHFDLSQIVNDLDPSDPDGNGYAFLAEGRTIGFWKHQHSVALTGKGKAQVNSATLLTYLTEIETLWLANPFNFGSQKLTTSLAYLSDKSPDAVALLLKQLVATELNHVHGLGLLDALPIQSLLLHYAEYVASHSTEFSRSEILYVKDILDAVNNSGH